MPRQRRWIICGLWMACAALLDGRAAAEDELPSDPETAFFEGLDLKNTGRYAEAIPLLRHCLELDPELHQARLYLAECYHMEAMYDEAVEELELYLQVDFAEADHERARQLLTVCQDAIKGTKEPPVTADGGTGSSAEPARGGWAPARIATGAMVTGFGNDARLVAVGPLLSGHFLLGKVVELTVFGRAGFGPYRDHEGAVTVPQFGGGLAASIPIGRPRLVVGALVPVVFSRYGGEVLVDAGITGQVGVLVPAGDSRLVLGWQFEGGYLVSPVVGGQMSIGIQVGPMGGAR